MFNIRETNSKKKNLPKFQTLNYQFYTCTCLCSQTSEEKTLWDSGLCPFFRGCPLLGGCLIKPPRITGERVNQGAGYGLKIPCAHQFLDQNHTLTNYEKWLIHFQDHELTIINKIYHVN